MILALVSACLVLSSPADDLSAALDSYAPKHFNGFLYIEKEGKPIYFHPVGFADREASKPFTMDTGIEIGSIVKPMSQIALLKLCKEGKLSLDDPLSKFFSNVPPDKAGITIGMVAHHRAGFQDVFGGDYQPMKRDELMSLMLKSKLLYKPGTEDRYSNSGYSMLATIMEKVTGQSFEHCVAERVFEPIGLKRTGYVLPKWRKDQVAVGYDKDGSRWGSPLDHFWFKDGPAWNLRGNGGMITTIPELARWTLAAHDGRLLDADSYKLFAPGLAGPDVKPGSMWAMAGGNGIFDTVTCYNPSRKMVVVAFSSDARFEIEDVLRGLLKTCTTLADQSG